MSSNHTSESSDSDSDSDADSKTQRTLVLDRKSHQVAEANKHLRPASDSAQATVTAAAAAAAWFHAVAKTGNEVQYVRNWYSGLQNGLFYTIDHSVTPTAQQLLPVRQFRTYQQAREFVGNRGNMTYYPYLEDDDVILYPINNLAHATNYLAQIKTADNRYIFKGGAKKIAETNLPLLWWSLNVIDSMPEDHKGDTMSQPFRLKSQYGRSTLLVGISNLMQSYAVGRESQPQNIVFRKLGTFFYKKEIMHALLVCLNDDDTYVLCLLCSWFCCVVAVLCITYNAIILVKLCRRVSVCLLRCCIIIIIYYHCFKNLPCYYSISLSQIEQPHTAE
jgi:hypothetical protein